MPGATAGGSTCFADVERSADAIGDFAGAREADGYRDFCARSGDIYRTLRGPSSTAQRPSPFDLVRRVGFGNMDELLAHAAVADACGRRSAIISAIRGCGSCSARYATYAAARRFLAPATLMLIAHVEQDGVWLVRGGMREWRRALRGVARTQGAELPLRCGRRAKSW